MRNEEIASICDGSWGSETMADIRCVYMLPKFLFQI